MAFEMSQVQDETDSAASSTSLGECLGASGTMLWSSGFDGLRGRRGETWKIPAILII